jgi:hypothetical protein
MSKGRWVVGEVVGDDECAAAGDEEGRAVDERENAEYYVDKVIGAFVLLWTLGVDLLLVALFDMFLGPSVLWNVLDCGRIGFLSG